MKKLISVLVLLAVSTAVVFAGGAEEAAAVNDGFAWVTADSDDAMLPGVDPALVEGDVITDGSSTVYPLSLVMIERFKREGYAFNATTGRVGSGGGFRKWTSGETDISNASRPIKDKEVTAAGEIGRTPIEFRVGTDALAVVVSNENDFVSNASMEELAAIFTADKWSDVNPEWPAEKILRYIPGTDSGTFDYFVEEVFDEDAEPILAANPNMSENDDVLVQGIVGSPYAIGFFGYAYYAENQDTLKILSIDGVEPIKANVDAAKYPLARPLFMYSDAEIMKSKPQVAAYLAFVLTYVKEEITEVGYFPASDADLNKAKQAWLDAMEGAL